MKYIKAILFCILFVSINIYAQDFPPIKKFSPEDYGGENQNWMISQATNKFIYVANNEGLLEYDGAKWTLHPSPNNSIIRAVSVIEDKIYTGCYMEFGYWSRNQFNKLQYHSLISLKLKEKMIEDEHFWNIIPFEEFILFQSLNRIYFYNTKSEEFSILNSKNNIIKLFNVNNTIYYSVINEGIYKIEEGKQKLILKSDIIKDGVVLNLFNHNDGLLVQTIKSGFYILKNDILKEWNIEAQEKIKKSNVYSSIQLKDKSFVLGTISNGIIKISKEGKEALNINQNNGLSNNTALSLYEDIDKNLWVGLDNGINCLNLKSPIRVFNDFKGNLGTVYASINHNNYIYLGTNQGLFFKQKNSSDSFKLVEGTSGQVWSLYVFNNELFCGHHFGTFLIEEDKALLIDNSLGTWNFRPIPSIKNALLQGKYDGLNILIKQNGEWVLRNKIKGFDNSVRYFEFNKNNEIFISHGYKGVFKIEFDNDFKSTYKIKKIKELPIGKNSSLVKHKNKILYAFENGVYGYNSENDNFFKDSILSSTIEGDKFITGKLVVDKNDNLWAFSNENLNYLTTNSITNKLKANSISIPSNLRKGKVGYENISLVSNDNYLIGTGNGFLNLNLKNYTNTDTNYIYLNQVEVKNRKGKTKNIDFSIPSELPFNQNSVVFNYSVPYYNRYQVTKYQYKLEGKSDEWSIWTEDPEANFENLSFGDYILKARGKVGNELTKNIISYNFKIMRPWYLSNMALLMYLLVFILVILILVRITAKYYKRQLDHKQLENEQIITKMKNEKLSVEIENKNRELAISTMSLIKKNEILSNLRKELKYSNYEDKNKNALKLIDKNLNNNQDWHLFVEAFNNADNHFLNKIKKLHPSLNSNDLRFCAYLRLKLSSKEIAPLLNISTKSVETRRYRLRKKLNLSREESLASYILQV